MGKHLSVRESGQRGQREQSKEGPGKSVEAILVSIIGSFSYSSLSLFNASKHSVMSCDKNFYFNTVFFVCKNCF